LKLKQKTKILLKETIDTDILSRNYFTHNINAIPDPNEVLRPLTGAIQLSKYLTNICEKLPELCRNWKIIYKFIYLTYVSNLPDKISCHFSKLFNVFPSLNKVAVCQIFLAYRALVAVDLILLQLFLEYYEVYLSFSRFFIPSSLK